MNNPLNTKNGNAVDTQLCQSLNSFNFELFYVISHMLVSKTSKKNLIISPFNMAQVISMILAGAQDETYDEIVKALQYHSLLTGNNNKSSDDTIYKSWNVLLTDLLAKNDINKNGNNQAIENANGIYLAQEYNLVPDYAKRIDHYFHARVQKLDFNDVPGSENKINSDISDQTHGKIAQILPANTLTPMTKVVLTSALYFKGEWEHKFDSNMTKLLDFHVASDETIKVNMMQGLHKGQIGDWKDHQALHLAYKMPDYSMLLILPKSGQMQNLLSDLKELHSTIGDSNCGIRQIVDELHSIEKIKISIPKFKVSYETELKEALTKLGILKMFSHHANLQGMIQDAETAYVSKVFHKATLEVNEEGSEASAATAGIIKVRALPIPHEFNANRPFVAFILFKGTILFSALITNPNN